MSDFDELYDCQIRIIGRKFKDIEKKLHVQDRQIEILMELVNEQRDTIQLIKYAFED